MENYTVKLTEQEINTILMALSGNVAVYESTRVKYDVKDLSAVAIKPPPLGGGYKATCTL